METVLSKDGTKIAYDRVGSGPAVILVGGAFSYRGFVGNKKLIEQLSNDFTVYNYDRRGRGDSDNRLPYSVEKEIDDLKALIAAAGGSAYVFGNSSGGGLALLAAANGARIDKLAVYEVPYMINEANRPSPDYRDRLQRLVDAGQLDATVKEFLRTMGAPGFAIFMMRIMPFWKNLRAVANTLPYEVAVMGDWSLPAGVLARITAPTLVIGGGKSDARLQRALKATTEALPHAQTRILEGQSHNVSMPMLGKVINNYFKG